MLRSVRSSPSCARPHVREHADCFLGRQRREAATAATHRYGGQKGTMWEGGFFRRVPFVTTWPAGLRRGRVTDEFLTSLEIFPTLLHVMGVAPPDVVLDGSNLLLVKRAANNLRRDRKCSGSVAEIKQPASEIGGLNRSRATDRLTFTATSVSSMIFPPRSRTSRPT